VEFLNTVRVNGHFRQPFPKTSKSARGIYLEDWAVEILKRRRETVDNDLVFPSATGTVWSPANLRGLLRGATSVPGSVPSPRELAGLPGFKPHTMRKTYGTAVERSFGIDTASVALRHMEVRTTRESYIRPAEMGPDVRSALTSFAPKAPDTTDPNGAEDKGN
jgi:integrase